MNDQIDVNGRTYRMPRAPVVVVCVDGSEPDYHERAIASGRMPFLASLITSGAGTHLTGECTIPSYTNPNNMSIATGVPPSRHGICGNTYFDPTRDVEVMMNDPALLRVPTIFAAFESAGARVAVVTAKDKLRRLLGHGLSASICVSAERASEATQDENGIDDLVGYVGMPQPDVYSPELSEFVLAAGEALLARRAPDLVYLTLTDVVQHRYAPGTPEANDFYAMIDGYLAKLDAAGAVVVVAADHGMNAKSAADGSPQVVYLQALLDEWLGAGRSRVVLPITDPYTRHHGSLGSFATIYLQRTDDIDVVARLALVPGIEAAVAREVACERFELPADRIGDLVVVAAHDIALGTSPGEHDLGQLERPLRSHGGIAEQRVPLVVNRRLAPLPLGHRLRNFDAYWLALNLVADGRGIETQLRSV